MTGQLGFLTTAYARRLRQVGCGLCSLYLLLSLAGCTGCSKTGSEGDSGGGSGGSHSEAEESDKGPVTPNLTNRFIDLMYAAHDGPEAGRPEAVRRLAQLINENPAEARRFFLSDINTDFLRRLRELTQTYPEQLQGPYALITGTGTGTTGLAQQIVDPRLDPLRPRPGEATALRAPSGTEVTAHRPDLYDNVGVVPTAHEERL